MVWLCVGNKQRVNLRENVMPKNNAVKSVMELHDPQSVVEKFFAICSRCDFDSAMIYIDEDCVYHNIPFHTARGKERIRRDLVGMGKAINLFEVEMVNIAVNGNVVLTERIDTIGGRFFKVALPIMGTLVVENGKITEWRDYFDWSFSMGKVGKSIFTNPFKALR